MPNSMEQCGATGARIAEILPESIAEELGVLPGDVLCTINDAPVSDYIAYRFAIADEEITLEIARGDEVMVLCIEKDADEDLGLVFESDVFDRVRPCRNKCVFCFEDQMPDGMRPSLSLRDDDYRLSFLHGNFLTLTNMSEADYDRIIREHLSPLFVSIHATDLEVRRRMLQNRRAPDIREQIRRLGEGGIDVHGQIVLCPGWNDGDVLLQTLADLADLHPTLLTVGIVPVGLTEHRPMTPEVRAVTPLDAESVLEAVTQAQEHCLARLGTRLVYAADEFYLAAGRSIPQAETYEGFEQQENGIGLARLFLDEMAEIALPQHLSNRKVTIATGTLAAPLLKDLADQLRLAGCNLEVVAVPNRFYGGGVSVAGLLTGKDYLAALSGRVLGEVLILPDVSLNRDGIFLDDMTPEEVETALGIRIEFCAGPRDVVDLLAE